MQTYPILKRVSLKKIIFVKQQMFEHPADFSSFPNHYHDD